MTAAAAYDKAQAEWQQKNPGNTFDKVAKEASLARVPQLMDANVGFVVTRTAVIVHATNADDPEGQLAPCPDCCPRWRDLMGGVVPEILRRRTMKV
jgi:hypothetical protein